MIPNKKYKQDALRKLFYEKRIQPQKWSCCNMEYTDKAILGRHFDKDHEKDLLEIENKIRQQHLEVKNNKKEKDNDDSDKLTKRRAQKGTSDPIEMNCDCDQSQHRVILFYEYVSIEDPVELAKQHMDLCGPKGLDVTGKIRISSEGMNVTIAGTKASIDQYMDWYMHSPNPLFSTTEKTPHDFFKPSFGCRHVFHPDLSIKIVDEICPLSQPTITLKKLQQAQHQQHKLSPAEFHAKLEQLQQKKEDNNTILLDTRNYYESKIGKFKGAITPPIRKFSVLPDYINQHKSTFNGKQILTYCTGGIRCEKATAYLRETLNDQETKIFMLDGGIHQYLNWVEEHPEITPLWQGKNYVFDARQNMGLPSIISQCQACHQPWDTYQKCRSPHCHLLVLYCDTCCAKQQPPVGTFCCQECEWNQQDEHGHCLCERLRKQQEASSIVLSTSSSSSSTSSSIPSSS